MTGFGSAQTRRDGYVAASEIKTVNNRYLKTACRISDGFSFLEQKIEALLREKIDRGTVSVTLHIRPEERENRFTVAQDAAANYIRSAAALKEKLPPGLNDLSVGNICDFFRLPGVIVDQSSGDADLAEKIWPLVQENLTEALAALDAMRDAEGASMAENLSALCDQLSGSIERVASLAPTVAEAYRQRLSDKVTKILAQYSIEAETVDIIREVALFTDKADISEEIVRFRSHLAQFRAAMAAREACGKRLDFLTQEMFREVNTIGSKANEAAITSVVVDMKTTIEKIREMVQNVE